MPDLLDNLNQNQKKAVTHPSGPAMVLAGAGSGKTKVLTSRVAWLIAEQAVQPEQILLVTFTNKAANEMNRRVESLVGRKLPLSGTFHSICAKILRQHSYALDLSPNFSIFDSDDQLAVIKTMYKEQGIYAKEYPPQKIKAIISSAKNELIPADEFAQTAQSRFQTVAANVYIKYDQALRRQQAVDFDDLLVLTVRLLQRFPEILSQYQRLLHHILVDEYQDTNTAQYTLTQLLARPQNQLFVVGDFAQSIYAWRGANYRNMLHLKQDFSDLVEYRLEQNYRSHQHILDAASGVIEKTTEFPTLSLWTERTGEHPIMCYETRTGSEEAHLVLRLISEQLLSKYDLNDVAILYRTNAQSRAFEEAAISWKIPYRLVGGFKFYERKEIKDVLSYVKVIINPSDEISRARLEKLGKRALRTFDAWLAKQTEIDKLPPAALLESILAQTKYLDHYDEHDPDDATRLENIQELINMARQFQTTTVFLENIALVQDATFADIEKDSDTNDSALTLMSLHSAKGLEYKVVFIVGMEEGLLPHGRSLMDPKQLEEERRLCYVGITRAKERLFFTYARQRWQHSYSSYAVMSRFLQDIPPRIMTFNSTDQGYSQQESSNVARQNTRGYSNKRTEYTNYTHNRLKESSQTKPSRTASYPDSTRRLVIDDDSLDALLQGEIDARSFLEQE